MSSTLLHCLSELMPKTHHMKNFIFTTLFFFIGIISSVAQPVGRSSDKLNGTNISKRIETNQHIRGAFNPAVKMATMPLTKPLNAPITETPKGKIQWYQTSWICLFMTAIVDNTGIASKLCFGDDGKLYFYDIASSGQAYWTVADMDDKGNIRIPLNQEVGYDPEYGKLTLKLIHFEEKEGMLNPVIDTDAEYYELVMDNDKVIRSADIQKEWMQRGFLALIDEEGGTSSLCGSMTMTPVYDEVVVPPTTATHQEYSYKYVMDGVAGNSFADVAFDGNDVYIKGICTSLPDIWLKGTIDNGKITFKSGQYMGAITYHHYFSAAHREKKIVDGQEKEVWVLDDEWTCNISEDRKTIQFEKDRRFTVLIAGDVSYALEQGELKEFKETLSTPQKPEIISMEDIGGIALFFIQPTVDVNGNSIRPENLSWRMYFDDKLYTFSPDTYNSLTEPLTEIPYAYNDDWDFITYGNEQSVYIYETEYNTIGVESVYTLNGEKMVSERAYYKATGISANETNKQVKETYYTGIDGRRVNKPHKGLYIKTEVYTDGTRQNRKIIVRK